MLLHAFKNGHNSYQVKEPQYFMEKKELFFDIKLHIVKLSVCQMCARQ